MKVKNILEAFITNLQKFVENDGEQDSDDEYFYVMIGDTYFGVDMNISYWYFEDDGTVVFRINDNDMEV